MEFPRPQKGAGEFHACHPGLTQGQKEKLLARSAGRLFFGED